MQGQAKTAASCGRGPPLPPSQVHVGDWLFSVLSMKSARAPGEVWSKWLRAAVLGTCATLAALLLWGSLGGDDGSTEVLAHRGEVLSGRFVEVPCSEDYNHHRRFEGAQCHGRPEEGSEST